MSGRKREHKLFAQRIIYIDPLNASSTIGYRVEQGPYNPLSVTVDLTDCNRRISWECNTRDTGRSVEKLDLAISMLRQARDEYLKRLKHVRGIKR